VHQILCKSRKECDGHPGSDQASVRGRKHERYTESPNLPRPRKERQVKSKVKSMLIIFFDIKGNVHKEFVLAGQSVSPAYYCNFSRPLRENVRRLRPGLWRQKSWVFRHDNTPSHATFFTGEFFTKTNITIVPPPTLFFSVSPKEDKTERHS
jgi:hypothetical protein